MHPDTKAILELLMNEGAFRAQRMAAEEAGIDVVRRISRGLYDSEGVLREIGQFFFARHQELDQAPYAYFLTYNVRSCLHDVSVQVGNDGIAALKGRAYAQIVTGTIERVRT